jgi:hypothetical protein
MSELVSSSSPKAQDTSRGAEAGEGDRHSECACRVQALSTCNVSFNTHTLVGVLLPP